MTRSTFNDHQSEADTRLLDRFLGFCGMGRYRHDIDEGTPLRWWLQGALGFHDLPEIRYYGNQYPRQFDASDWEALTVIVEKNTTPEGCATGPFWTRFYAVAPAFQYLAGWAGADKVGEATVLAYGREVLAALKRHTERVRTWRTEGVEKEAAATERKKKKTAAKAGGALFAEPTDPQESEALDAADEDLDEEDA